MPSQSNLVFFYSPAQVAAKEAPVGRTFRLGGLVDGGSVQRDGLVVRFVVTDTVKSIPVRYQGILPDLFKEGKGVVAQGQLRRRWRVRRTRGARQARRELHAARSRRSAAACRRQQPENRRNRRQGPQAMIPELGQIALLLALATALIQGTLPLLGAARGRADWMSLARPAAQTQFLLVALAFGCLVSSFVRHDFSVLNVATNSNSALPLFYRVAASWGSHEGSLLLWVLMLSTWTLAVALRSRHLPMPVVSRILAVMGPDQRGLPAVHADHLQSLRAPVPGAAGRQRPEPAAAGPGG